MLGKPVVTIPGCPPNPYNFLATAVHFLTFGKLPATDKLGRPLFAYGRLVHENCERRAHFDAGRFAMEFGDEGHRKGYCLYKLGCKGPETYANCPSIGFGDAGEGNWPVGCGHPCIGCTEKGVGFTKPIHQVAKMLNVTPPLQYPRIVEEQGKAVAELDAVSDFVLLDCPGSHTRLSQMAHTLADTLITPMNDSFVDFDLLARLTPEGKVLGPSIYAEMVWAARQLRGEAGAGPIDWLGLRNRLGTQAMHNKRKVGGALATLSKRIGFRVAPGFSERVIFRELFPRGLTLLDLKDVGTEQLSMSNIAARQELRELIAELNLPGVSVAF